MPQGRKSATFPPVGNANHAKEALGNNDLGGAMLRLTFLLCSGLFLVMVLAGRDFGQLRPGLALAEAEAKNFPATPSVPVVETAALVDTVALAPDVPVAVAVEAVAAEQVAAVPQLFEQNAVTQPADQLLQAQSEPTAPEAGNSVFTLSDYADPVPEAVAQTVPEKSSEGEVWYVAGTSLNVRSGPSTSDEVVGKLMRGEATLVVWREGEDWARIRIEGDGIEGYVAMRFLTSEVPVVN